MKQCYMLTSDEKAYLKQVLANTLRLTSKRKGSFKYISNIDIRDTDNFVCCKIIGERIIEDHAWVESPYSNRRWKRKLPVTWFYTKDGDDFNKLVEELVPHSVANYMVFEKFMTDNKEIDFCSVDIPYSNHSTFVDWLCDQKIKESIVPSEEIKNNFKKVIKMIKDTGLRSLNEKLIIYNAMAGDLDRKEND